MNRRNYLIAGFYAVLGLWFTAHEYPQLRTLQILLPFAFGLAAGVALGRARWSARAAS
jgi:hypothetical protein